LTDYGGDAYFLSTPKGRNGFWQMYQWGIDPEMADWACWKMPSYVNTKIDKAELDAMRDTLPEMAYRQEILAEFLENEGSVFRNIAACMNAPTTTPAEHRGHTIVAGLDLAKQNDFTVISIGCRDCRMEIARDRFNQVDYLFQVGRIKAICDKWNVQSLLVDSTGVGSPVLEQLQNDGLPALGFVFTATTKPPLIENLALAFERTEWQFQPDPVWTLEIEAYERTVSATTGRSSYSAPEGGHDDTVMARCLMVWQARNSVSMFDIL
jgi:hypothetical protein